VQQIPIMWQVVDDAPLTFPASQAQLRVVSLEVSNSRSVASSERHQLGLQDWPFL